MDKAYLVLADGTIYEGFAFGADVPAVGETVFTTAVVGYAETLANPCYTGQIVVQTFPLAGNYGIIEEDLSGSCAAAGFVVREWCDAPSNFRSQYDLDAYLKQQNIPGICGIDTRSLTRKLREEGSMNAMICRSIPEDLSAIKNYVYSGAVSKFSCAEKTVYPVENPAFSIAMLDLGANQAIVSEMNKLNCSVTLYPCNTSTEEILSGGHSGLILSDGGGNPAENTELIAETAKLMGKIPMLGVGLGHLTMALACGGEVCKMKAGHHGSNQPVKDLSGGRCYITGQSHLYAAVSGGEISFVNVNDGSCEGMAYPGQKAFSVQFMPESCVGPNDTSFIYKRFISLMGGDDQCR